MTPNPPSGKRRTPRIGATQIRLLERLTNACAVSGDEKEVRTIVMDQVRPHADEVKVDAVGNVLVSRRGQGENRLRVMLAAHMDEVGFMLTSSRWQPRAFRPCLWASLCATYIPRSRWSR